MQWGNVKITNFHNDMKWYFPKTKNGQLIGTPTTDGSHSILVCMVPMILVDKAKQ